MDRDSESDDDDDSGLQFDHRLQPTLPQQWTFNRIFLTAGFFRLLLICYARVHDYLFQASHFWKRMCWITIFPHTNELL